MELQGVAGETSAALGADPDLLGAGAVALVYVEANHEAQRPDAAHLGQEGVRTLGARGQHAAGVARLARSAMTQNMQSSCDFRCTNCANCASRRVRSGHDLGPTPGILSRLLSLDDTRQAVEVGEYVGGVRCACSARPVDEHRIYAGPGRTHDVGYGVVADVYYAVTGDTTNA